MRSTMPVVSLEEVVVRRLGGVVHDATEAIATVEGKREREHFLRRLFPPILVRRLDRGFARSNTVHPDTARALYAVARAVRAEVTIETGTYWGYSTSILAQAARDEGRGVIHSFDLYPKAGAHIPKALRPWIRLHRGKPATESMPTVLADLPRPKLFFQDSVHDYGGVVAELTVARAWLALGAVVLFHDFVEDAVLTAAHDGLPGYWVARIEGDDPQQVGIAIAPGGL
jgi:hypothetical protein